MILSDITKSKWQISFVIREKSYLVIGYISEESATKRPYLEALSLSSDYWLGSVSHAMSGMKSTVSTAHSIPSNSTATEQNTEPQ